MNEKLSHDLSKAALKIVGDAFQDTIDIVEAIDAVQEAACVIIATYLTGGGIKPRDVQNFTDKIMPAMAKRVIQIHSEMYPRLLEAAQQVARDDFFKGLGL